MLMRRVMQDCLRAHRVGSEGTEARGISALVIPGVMKSWLVEGSKVVVHNKFRPLGSIVASTDPKWAGMNLTNGSQGGEVWGSYFGAAPRRCSGWNHCITYSSFWMW